jgi:hypothetical protein
MMASGQWLEAALQELSGKIESGLQLDGDLIAGLVSFCELAPPLDAADYIKVCAYFLHPLQLVINILFSTLRLDGSEEYCGM